MAKAPAMRGAASAPAGKNPSPNAILARNIRRFVTLHGEIKAGDSELDGLKAYFRKEAGDADRVFTDGEHEIVVTREERTGWNGEALETHLGADAAALKKTTSFVKVMCRQAKEASE